MFIDKGNDFPSSTGKSSSSMHIKLVIVRFSSSSIIDILASWQNTMQQLYPSADWKVAMFIIFNRVASSSYLA